MVKNGQKCMTFQRSRTSLSSEKETKCEYSSTKKLTRKKCNKNMLQAKQRD